MGRGGPAKVSRPSRRPSLRSDGLRTGPNARPGSRLAPCLRGYGESNPTPPRLSRTEHRRFGIARLTPRMAIVGMKIQASRAFGHGGSPEVRSSRRSRGGTSPCFQIARDGPRSIDRGCAARPLRSRWERRGNDRGNDSLPGPSSLRGGGRRAGDGSFPPQKRAVIRLGRCDPGDGP